MFTEDCFNDMLDAIDFDGVRIHSGDPGGSGVANALGSGVLAATFAAASSASRALSADVDFTGLTPATSVPYFSVWSDGGTVFRGSIARSAGDAAVNASGEYSIKAGTSVGLANP